MSYCRFSSDNFQCDVYCYAADNGYVIDVAVNRQRDPSVADRFIKSIGTLTEAELDAILAKLVPIGLPNDGQRIVCATPGEAATALVGLQKVGYRVPQRAIDALREEAKMPCGCWKSDASLCPHGNSPLA